jgi:hypothetical protein
MARVVLKEVVIAEIAVRNVPAAVFPDNRLRIGLIRMSFLAKLSRLISPVAGSFSNSDVVSYYPLTWRTNNAEPPGY